MKQVKRKPLIAPEAPDDDAEVSLPDNTWRDDGWYQNLRLENLDLSQQQADDVVLERSHLRKVNLAQGRLRKVRLSDLIFEDCNLEGLRLEGAILERVEFRGCRLLGFAAPAASFEDVLFDHCDARYARLLDVKAGTLEGHSTMLREASFQSAELTNTVFHDCDLRKCDFRDSRLVGADFRGSRLEALVIHPKDLFGAVIAAEQAVDLISLLGVQVN